MGATRPLAAPNPEWVQMYRAGLSRGRIAALTGTSPSTVGYHLRVAKTVDPGLRSAHETAAARKTTTKVTYQGLARMKELVTSVQETGRYPSQNASDLSERTLAAWLKRRRHEAHAGTLAPVTSERALATWLQRRREDARAGTLAPAFRDGLAVLPGWEGKRRSEANEDRWQEWLAALVAYRAAGNDWPRHKAFVTGEEHDLGVWLHTQRYKARRGELDPQKAEALDTAAPGWRTGRQRALSQSS